MVSAGDYGGDAAGADEKVVIVGREDSLRVIAASNTILALILVGVLGLQAGQWYAERKEDQELEGLRRSRLDAAGGHAVSHRGGGSKKKQ